MLRTTNIAASCRRTPGVAVMAVTRTTTAGAAWTSRGP